MNTLIARGNHVFPIYEYLKKHVISCLENADQLRERVREIYYDMLNEEADVSSSDLKIVIFSPTASGIAEKIDYENVAAIVMTCGDNGFSENETDEIIALYSHEIGCMLDDYVIEILQNLGYALSRHECMPRQTVSCQKFIKYEGAWGIWKNTV